jgi:regulator of protease activity HflC (stomatin/prohibitin superfamily)
MHSFTDFLLKILSAWVTFATFYLVFRLITTTTTIYEYQQGLLYRNGRFGKLLWAGRYSTFKGSGTKIEVVDTRKMILTVGGQELLTKDKISIKVSVAGFYQVVDALQAKQASKEPVREVLHLVVQVALRELVGSLTLEELVEQKPVVNERLLAQVAESAAAFGLKVSDLAVRDIMMPANLKKAFSAVFEAKREAERLLEQARGEQAVLRNLTNAATLYQNHPMLYQARLIQTLAAGGNSLVLNGKDDSPHSPLTPPTPLTKKS